MFFLIKIAKGTAITTDKTEFIKQNKAHGQTNAKLASIGK
jgi:hypothetical protein